VEPDTTVASSKGKRRAGLFVFSGLVAALIAVVGGIAVIVTAAASAIAADVLKGDQHG
jgi:hypothetical protein